MVPFLMLDLSQLNSYNFLGLGGLIDTGSSQTARLVNSFSLKASSVSSCFSISFFRSVNDASSVNGGSEASRRRFARACVSISTSLSPTGNPAPVARAGVSGWRGTTIVSYCVRINRNGRKTRGCVVRILCGQTVHPVPTWRPGLYLRSSRVPVHERKRG